MVRALVTVALLMGLSACQFGGGGRENAVSTQTTNDTRIAKEVFGYLPTPAAMEPESVGGYANGCQAGAVELPETGETWQAMRLSRNRNWAQPTTVSFVQDLSAFAATQPGWSGLYVGDMSQPRGGPMLSGHASHQTGLDIDVWMLPPNRLNLSASERENISSIRMDSHEGAYVNSSWTPQHEAILRRAAEDPRVARIFVFAGAKVEMCKNATGDRSWLNKIRPWHGHNYHFHVRLNCVRGDRNCAPQDPPPAGDGCADAQAWVDNILNPPPAQPSTGGGGRGPLRMNDLPAMCGTVAAN